MAGIRAQAASKFRNSASLLDPRIADRAFDTQTALMQTGYDNHHWRRRGRLSIIVGREFAVTDCDQLRPAKA
jgi:hypothetical protein